MHSESERKRRERRRRTCLDEMRRNLAQRQRRRGDSVGKLLLRLLTLASVALALVPSFEERSYAPRDRRQPPPGYTLGRAAWARERGLEPEDDEFQTVPEPKLKPMPRPLPGCSWFRLVKDLRRRPTRDRAREMIEERVPPEAQRWLRKILLDEDWGTLRLLGRDADPMLIRERAVLMALAADLLERQPEDAIEDELEPTVEGIRP